ncbi:DsbA family protein [Pararoseomonas indoligenes]|uniref:Thioredoxin domain-containing protein n=1 Tax=Roseomonas indoligenes TaxID=2820811 RepID=A0A940S2M5_9PROT|nr:thioredoxin domain-containing protein [Pararoseomonas indoligenes]MBP0491276.1 thioredoxin domain-containing protein [Pararoseomonas indoligenes]
MSPTRRSLLLAAPAIGLLPSLAHAQGTAPGTAPANDPRLGDRSAGRADAGATVVEYFSLTCSHCANFHNTVWPQVKSRLVDTGKVRMVWRDFPLDQLALAAAMVARALPAERYEGFVGALFSSQDRWAFARGADNIGEIAKIAALAGMNRAEVDNVLKDTALQRGVLEMRQKAQQEFNVSSTPTFIFNNKPQPGEVTYERFAQLAGVSGS